MKAVHKNKTLEVVVTDLADKSRTSGTGLHMLSAEERARVDRYALHADQHRYVLRQALLRCLLATRLKMRPQDVRLVTGPHGKPALADAHAQRGLEFNVSHCRDTAVYVFSWAGEVGVDIEAVRPVKGADEIAATMFSQHENAAYRALSAQDRLRGFFNCWTRKEAFVKAIGSGLGHSLKRFDVSLAPGEPARILRVDDMPGGQCGWRVREFAPAPGWVGAVVTRDALCAGPGSLLQ